MPIESSLTPIIWAFVTFPIVWFMERWIHRHLQGLVLILTGNINWSILIYAILLFPGVLLHELSHWLTAILLGLRTGKFSVWPSVSADGHIRLGYVEYYKDRSVGPIRESLVGGAPLIYGTISILLIGFYIFNATELLVLLNSGTPTAVGEVLERVFQTDDALLWLYLLFAVSNAMMPSPSDRKAFPAFFTILAIIVAALYFLGFEEALWNGLVGPVAIVFGYLGMAFTMTIGVNILFMLLIWLLETVSSRLRGRTVNYRR